MDSFPNQIIALIPDTLELGFRLRSCTNHCHTMLKDVEDRPSQADGTRARRQDPTGSLSTSQLIADYVAEGLRTSRFQWPASATISSLESPITESTR